MALRPRRLIDLLRARIAGRPITVLTGARQTGKTTLVRDSSPTARTGSAFSCRVPRRSCSSPPSADEARLWRARAEDHFLRGGYPALEPLPPAERRAWLRDFRRTYLERDLADLGHVADLDQFALAQNLIAARTAGLLSCSEVARELGVAVHTVKRYARFLEISYQVVLLRPLLPAVTTRLVKTPKLYWTDPALARLLAEHTGTSVAITANAGTNLFQSTRPLRLPASAAPVRFNPRAPRGARRPRGGLGTRQNVTGCAHMKCPTPPDPESFLQSQ